MTEPISQQPERRRAPLFGSVTELANAAGYATKTIMRAIADGRLATVQLSPGAKGSTHKIPLAAAANFLGVSIEELVAALVPQ